MKKQLGLFTGVPTRMQTLALAMCLVLPMFFMFPLQAHRALARSANTVDLSVGSAHGVLGGSVTVPINISNNTSLSAFDFTINYDKTRLTPIRVDNGEAWPGHLIVNLNAGGGEYVKITSLSNINYANNGPIAYVTFEIKGDAATGRTNIDLLVGMLGYIDEENGMGELLFNPISNGIITVGSTPGRFLTGAIKTYNPQNPATIRLMRDGIEADMILIAPTPGNGQVVQRFTFADVEPGIYSLVVSKAAHTNFTVLFITAGSTDVDLTEDSREAVKLMTLLCGDVNGDGFINVNDLNEVWSARNYNKNAAQADNPNCDLNGDGFINVNDLNIVWSATNYNKRDVVVP